MSAALCGAGGPAVLLNVWTQSRETISLTQPDHRWVVVSGNAAFHFRIQQLGERAVASCCSAAVSAASSGICTVGKCKWDSLNPVDPHNWTISHNHQAAVTQSHNECYLWSHAQASGWFVVQCYPVTAVTTHTTSKTTLWIMDIDKPQSMYLVHIG